MKKLFLTLAAAMMLAPAAIMAQNTTTKTWFEGEHITGVAASSAFRVTLVKSNRTRAVVEVDRDLERYVRVALEGGVVSVGMRSMNNREQREFNDLVSRRNDKTLHLTLHLPTLNSIRLSGSSSLASPDAFPGRDLDIHTSSSAGILGELKIASERVKLQCSSSSKIENLILDQTTDLTVVTSSSSRATITAPKLKYSKIGVSSSAELRLNGAGGEAHWSASSSARIDATNFTARELNLSASSSASVRAGVEAAGANLSATASSSANVNITARGVGMSNISCTSGASVHLSGNGETGKWNTTSSGRIIAEEFALKELTVDATSGSSVRTNVSGTLTTRTNSGGSVRYAGNPSRVNDLSSGVRPL